MKKERLMGRVLAIDYGTKRIGLAVSDALGITAQGLPTRTRTRNEDDLRHIGELVEEYSVALVIVGNPVSQSGGETAMSQQAGRFAEKLARRVSCTVKLWDERLTTEEAMRVLRGSGVSIEKRRQARDRVAATLLLQSYLDFHSNEFSRSSAAGPVQS